MNAKVLSGVSLSILACVALLTGGCSKKDDSGSSGGSSIVIAPPPSSRPTLAGMNLLVDGGGGTATGSGAGGKAGTVSVTAINGSVVEGAGTPGIDNNFLTSAVLADNVVTFTELKNINPGAYFEDSSQQIGAVDLYGFDFYLPAGATLDLSGAGIGTVDAFVVRTHLPGDVVRIDGAVTGVRAGDACALGLITSQATGVSVSVSGAVDLSGANGGDAGFLDIESLGGSASFTGALTATGADSSTGAAGIGGSLNIAAHNGDVYLAPGMFRLNGGSGGGAGGAGGVAQFATSNAGGVTFNWGVQANGGSGGNGVGGAGGTLNMQFDGTANMFLPCELNGGSTSGTSANGGAGGAFNGSFDTLTGVIQAASAGGDGGMTLTGAPPNGGAGGICGISADVVHSFAFDVSGDGGAGYLGGKGVIVGLTVYADIQQALLEASGAGGQGVVSGGSGGDALLQTRGYAANVAVTAMTGGGAATGASSIGGAGGSIQVQAIGIGGSVSQYSLDLTAVGGTGTQQGGNGGPVTIEVFNAFFGGLVQAQLTTVANGGAASGSGGIAGNGGVIVGDLRGPTASLELNLTGTAVGGAATGGTGGEGGHLTIQSFTPSDPNGSISVGGTLDARGGLSGGANSPGGDGGDCLIVGGDNGLVRISDFFLDVSGGDSQLNNGSAGGTINVQARTVCYVTGGSFTASGGNGSTVSGTGVGGAGNLVSIRTDDADLLVDTTLVANGGDGAGGGGSGGTVQVNTNLSGSGAGSYMSVAGSASALGGAATGTGPGGGGGNVNLVSDSITSTIYTSVFDISATLDASGGAGSSAVGGNAGSVVVAPGGPGCTISGDVAAIGGSGNAGGDGGTVKLYGGDNGPMTISSIVSANGGTGTSGAGGAGGSITVRGGQDGQMTVSGTVMNHGGAGSTAGGDAGSLTVEASSGATITISGTLSNNGGTGITGGNGNQIDVGSNTEANVTLTGTAIVRSNGGAANGSGGDISLDPTGTGGAANPNLDEQTGSVVESVPDGTGSAGAITRN
ncbi:MAG: hypothetical protein KDB82_00410 [Planctomycetes bacterium]|nr:hypothetical protein [Planctomycetota bacterium]